MITFGFLANIGEESRSLAHVCRFLERERERVLGLCESPGAVMNEGNFVVATKMGLNPREQRKERLFTTPVKFIWSQAGLDRGFGIQWLRFWTVDLVASG